MEGFAAIAKNLAALKDDEGMLAECRSAHLREAALLICDGIVTDDLPYNFDSFRERYKSACNAIDSYEKLHANDRIVLCSHIAHLLSENMSADSLLKKFFSSEDLPKDPVICYLRNPIADLAYTEFTRDKPQAGVMYADSFQAVCENLSGGKCDYAILPVVSGSDGRLIRFEGMIASYGFAVSALISVTPNADSAPDTFALLSRNVKVPNAPLADLKLCFTFSVPDGTEIANLLRAAKFSGFGTVDIRTQAFSERKNWSLTFDITNGKVAPFLAYLALEHAGFIANGLFTV